MIPLDSPKWEELKHAYGFASDIPELLRRLAKFPPKEDIEAEPYFSLWSSLCHQDDVYTASYAAVPHIIEFAVADPTHAPDDCFQLPACIEISRAAGRGPAIPSELKEPYFVALGRIPILAAKAATGAWNDERSVIILAAVAAAKGQTKLAQAILELDPDTIEEFLESRFD